MSRKYQEKQPTGCEYVDKTKVFCDYTYAKGSQLPQKWMEIYIHPLMDIADKIENLTRQANKIYINPKNQDVEAQMKGYNKRIDLLCEAINLFADFDVKFDRLMGVLDVSGTEKKRLKTAILNIIKNEKENNPDIKDININIITHTDAYEYRSAGGDTVSRIRLTIKNKDYWLKCEDEALTAIKSRVSSDRRIINKIKQQLTPSTD